MQKAKDKKLKSTDEEGDSSMADPDDKEPGTEQKEDDEKEEILEDVGGIQFEVSLHCPFCSATRSAIICISPFVSLSGLPQIQ